MKGKPDDVVIHLTHAQVLTLRREMRRKVEERMRMETQRAARKRSTKQDMHGSEE